MKRLEMFVVGSLMLVLSLSLHADVREAYICNYADGKDMDDLMSARDFYVKEAEKAGLEPATAFVWTPVKAGGDRVPDVLWFNNYDDEIAFAKQSDAFAASAPMEKVNERFNSVMTCNSAIASREVVYNSGELTGSNPTVIIASTACMVRPDVSAENLEDLWSHVRAVLGRIDAYKNHLLYRTMPTTSGRNSPDLRLYSVNSDMTDWASKRAAFQASEATPQLMRHFQSTLDCNTSLWTGQRVVPVGNTE
ncbi:MAG TPA: hypothetical protein QGF41_10605 [Gammaproteobacteria bacterium]|jgi:hypothetical protein|nr:hypothetical protein [Gammaproteobacteria bacterium]